MQGEEHYRHLFGIVTRSIGVVTAVYAFWNMTEATVFALGGDLSGFEVSRYFSNGFALGVASWFLLRRADAIVSLAYLGDEGTRHVPGHSPHADR